MAQQWKPPSYAQEWVPPDYAKPEIETPVGVVEAQPEQLAQEVLINKPASVIGSGYNWLTSPILEQPEAWKTQHPWLSSAVDFANPTPLDVGIAATGIGMLGGGLIRMIPKGLQRLEKMELPQFGKAEDIFKGGPQPYVHPVRIDPETKLFTSNPFGTRKKTSQFPLPSIPPLMGEEAKLTERLRKGEMKVFDTLEEVKKNINDRTDWTPEKKAQVLERINQQEIKANGELPNDPSLFGKINANAKSLLTFDFPGITSALGRQGLPLFRTKAYWTSLDDMFKSWGSQRAFEDIKKAVYSKDLFKERFTGEGKRIPSIAEVAGLDLGYDERFARSWIQRNIAPFRANERAYEAFMLKLKTDHFETLYNQAVASGRHGDELNKVMRELADTINIATGKGGEELSKATQAIKFGSFAPLEMFAPRYVQSRFQMLDPRRMLDPRISPEARKEHLKNFLALSSASMVMNGLYKLAGAKVNLTDPTQSDFAKASFGKIAADPNAGVQQPLVLGSRLIEGLVQTLKEGKVSRFGEAVGRDYAAQFLTSRLAPVQSFLAAAMLTGGKDFDMQPFEWKKAIIDRATPIMIQDILDIYAEDPGLLPLVIPSMLGQGVNVYTK